MRGHERALGGAAAGDAGDDGGGVDFDPMEISGHSYDLRAETIQRWAESDPLAVKEFLDGRTGDQYMERVHREFVRTWAAYDPEAARAWMEAQIARTQAESDPESAPADDGQDMVVAWLRGVFAHDHAGALEYLRTQTDPRVVAATRDIVGALYAESPAQTREFILQLPEERRATALAGVSDQRKRWSLRRCGRSRAVAGVSRGLVAEIPAGRMEDGDDRCGPGVGTKGRAGAFLLDVGARARGAARSGRRF